MRALSQIQVLLPQAQQAILCKQVFSCATMQQDGRIHNWLLLEDAAP